MRLPVNRSLPLAALVFLSACGGGGARVDGVPAAAPNGPAADYPMVLGAPFTIDGVTYTPVDSMNYDLVGFAGIGAEGGSSVSGANRTLPLPSYVEVTALDTGKTILVRIERRGPMSGGQLVQLSPGAAAQLGLSDASRGAVRVRRVNPPEADRALLRMGQAAPARMDTPKSLLTVLQRKLDQQTGTTPPAPVPTPEPTPVAAGKPAGKVKDKPKVTKVAAPKPAPMAKPEPVAKPEPAAKPAATGSYYVQVGAFSNKANASAAASKAGGQVIESGKLWRVRAGPFTNQDAAKPALAKAKAAGYSDARIQRTN